ncbi:MAG: apolipoprotein N-acyltransferase [Candidatus Omnitrophica bacterium]|nr:apolipoprotein N-acyltransferase [Candidatus Omnitrophota bacterium]
MNIFLSILSAVFLVCSFPNFNFYFLVWVGLVPFFILLDAKSPKAAFLWGWLTGFLFFLGTHYWLIHVTLPGMILVNIYLGIYFGLFGLGYALLQKLPLKHKLWVLPSLWAALELTRDRLFTGFGWACLGHSQYQILPLIQIADITGVFGVSFLVVMVNVLLKDMLEKKKVGDVPTYLGVIAVMICVLMYGMTQVQYLNDTKGEFMRVAVVQPNVPQSRKWEPESWEPTQKKILALTEQALQQKPDLIIWPETSFPGYTWQSPDRYEEIKDFVARHGVPLLLGTVTMRDGKYYNSAILLQSNGQEGARYDKMHLVPFGEFLPLRPLLGWIGRFAPIGDDFSRGERLTVFPPGFSTLVCFEDTVAPIVRQLAKQDPGFLVNITNDGWFKDTNEPFLHLQGAVFQAVANRRTIVRAANTGVSSFIDPRGQVAIFKNKAGKSVMSEGFLIGQVRSQRQRSFYTNFGDVFAYLCFFAAGLALIKRKIWL